MMKVQVRDSHGDVTLQVCGRLADPWVKELEQCWLSSRSQYPRGAIAVDLRGVSFIDPAGERLLRSMHENGASFQTAGVLIREIVNQITGQLR
jgi:anti-anti-sigma regulatory factor